MMRNALNQEKIVILIFLSGIGMILFSILDSIWEWTTHSKQFFGTGVVTMFVGWVLMLILADSTN